MRFRPIAALVLLSVASEAASAVNLPRPAGDFAINVAPGQQFHLSRYKGKTVVLAFILTYCSHCQKVVGVLTKAQNDFGARGLQVLASAVEDKAALALPEFLRKFYPPFPVGYNPSSEFLAYMQHPPMLVPYMPAVMFIDKEGVIRTQYEGRDAFLEESAVEKNIRARIEEMLGPPAQKGVAKKKGK
jgi:peroxiredoxin